MMPGNSGELCQVSSSDINGDPPISEAASSIEATFVTANAAETIGGGQKNGLSLCKPKNFKAGFKINQLADMLAKRSLKMVEGSDGEASGLSTSVTQQQGSPPLSYPLAEDASPAESQNTSLLGSEDNIQAPPLLHMKADPLNRLDVSSEQILCPPSSHPPSLTPVCEIVSDALSQPTHACTAESFKTECSPDELSEFTNGVDPSPPPPTLSPAPEQQPPLLEPQVPPLVSTALIHSDDSTNTHPVRTRSSPRSKKQLGPVETETPPRPRKGKTRKGRQRNKKLVEMSTQTSDIPFISLASEQAAAPELQPCVVPAPSAEPPVLKPAVTITSPTYICLFCQLTFIEKTDCLNHEATHTLKRKTKFIKCQFCMKKLPNLEDFKSHCVKHHNSNFYLCSECDLRFYNEQCLTLHTKNDHYNPMERTHFTIFNKKVKTSGSCLDIDVNCDVTKRPSISPRCVQRVSPKEKTEDQLYEAEMLFYSHLSGNIQENLSNHLDGKIGRIDSVTDLAESSKNSGSLLAVVSHSNGSAGIPLARAPSPYQTRSKTPNPLPSSAKKFKKLPNWQQKFWEKYNFPTNYRFEHRFWDKSYASMEKSPLYLKDLSCLDIKTQLTMRENVKKLEEFPDQGKEGDKDSFPYYVGLMPVPLAPVTSEAPPPSIEIVRLPKKKARDNKSSRRSRYTGENNVPQVVTRRQSCLDVAKQRKGSLDLGTDSKMTLRRQTSVEASGSDVVTPDAAAALKDSKDSDETVDTFVGTSAVSGEWVRPRTYVCGACCSKFSNLWDLEDHKWAIHPNVWCTHYEFEVEKLERVFHLEDEQDKVARITLPDLYRRYLSPKGSLGVDESLISVSYPHPCSKCRKLCPNQAELHRHILDCGGDTTWSQTMCSSPAALKRRWRPYGSRRRKLTAQRGVKRTTTSTPPLRTYITQPKIRTKPGDVESIQKMLANLPEKRTRRAINFDEVSTRSQTTIQNNRLLRKRLSFSSSHLREKVLTVARQRIRAVNMEVKNDPRRKFLLKEVTVDVTPLTMSSPLPPPKEIEYNPIVDQIPKKTKKVLSVENTKLVTRVTGSKKPKPRTDKGSSANTEAGAIVRDTTPPVKRLPGQQRLKKQIVKRKGDIIKTIKKRLTSSKKSIEARRRSNRIKNLPKDDDGDSSNEEQLPISKLKDIKKKLSPDSPKISEIVEAGDDMPTNATAQVDPPTEINNVPENIVIRVVRPNRKQSRKMLKVEKKPVVLVKPDSLPDAASPANNVADSQVPVVNVLNPLCSTLTEAVAAKKISSRKGRGRKRWCKKKPTNKILNVCVGEVTSDEAQVVEIEPKVGQISVIVPAKEQLPEPERFSNFTLEKIITDKLNENLVRRKGNRKHDRPKSNFKGLRMTVTLKEATLKVLDKPVAAPGPNKWSSVNPVDAFIKFDSPGVQVAQVTVQNSEPDPTTAVVASCRKSRRLSKNKEESEGIPSEIEMEQPSALNDEVKDITSDVAIPLVVENKVTSFIEETNKELHEISAVTDSRLVVKNDFEETDCEEVRLYTADTCKSSSDVSTTVLTFEETAKDMKEASVCVHSCTSSDVMSAPEIKSIMPIFTIEEATSSEDVSKPAGKSSCAPKIAEADSTGEKVDSVSCSDLSNYEKTEPEMVVSSTNPVGSSRKRKKRQSVVEFDCKDEVPSSTLFIPEELDRRSRRKSKEVPSSNEFIIDDPLLLVDELWSDLDSDSDSRKKKVRRVKKKTPKKRVPSNKEVDLEALLRNFGEKKSDCELPFVKCLPMKRKRRKELSSRERTESKVVLEKIPRRISTRLFSFNKKITKHGRAGEKLLTSLQRPLLPAHPSLVTENPEQVIVCRAKRVRKKKMQVPKIDEIKPIVNDFKVSLPLELLGDLSLLNNNHLRSTDVICPPRPDPPVSPLPVDPKPETKLKRSDCIDKIFCCEICQTYYYSSCQLRTHKQSNRHKQNEIESLREASQTDSPCLVPQLASVIEETTNMPQNEENESEMCALTPAKLLCDEDKPKISTLFEDKNDDSSEMPVLEGPFIETRPVEPLCAPLLEQQVAPIPTDPAASVFGFSEESLKNIQNAIGCTDEEMLILTLLGENTAPEPDILDLSNYKPKPVKVASVEPEIAKPNGTSKTDLKQRMTSALASLVNRAYNNLQTKTASVSKAVEKMDAMTFLNKLSSFSNRRISFNMADVSTTNLSPASEHKSQISDKEDEKYRFKCEYCGNRFEKETTRDFHIARSHHRRKNKLDEDDDWSQWNESEDTDMVPSSQFLCSECRINFMSPQEVVEHQRAEHQSELPPGDVKKGAKVTHRRDSDLDAKAKRVLANKALQKLGVRRPDRKSWGRKLYCVSSPKLKKYENSNDIGSDSYSCPKNTTTSLKTMDVYDFNEFDSDPEPAILTHVKKSAENQVLLDDDSEDNIPLASVKKPVEFDKESLQDQPTRDVQDKDSFKISLRNNLLRLPLQSGSDDDSVPLMFMSKEEEVSRAAGDALDGNVIFHSNNSVNSFGSHSDSEQSVGRTQKELHLAATVSKKDSKNVKIAWNNPVNYDDEIECDVDKEAIMKKVWKKKKKCAEKTESASSSCDSMKIKQTEISDEVVIKCGPREKSQGRPKSDESEMAKSLIVRRIWSGKCGIQTKAALKTYDSDLVVEQMPLSESSPCNTPPPTVPTPSKRRSRGSAVVTKRKKVSNVSEDDLDSLLDEIEQENVEKAIRLEFLHLRRSEKSHIEPPKEPPGLFAEKTLPEVKPEKKKRRGMKNVRLGKRRSEGSELSKRHKKHRHRHHHHKHKHKKSRHHKSVTPRHRNKHRGEGGEGASGEMTFRVLERMCQDIAPRPDIDPTPRRIGADTYIRPRISTDLDNLDLKLDEILSPLESTNNIHGDMSDDEFETHPSQT